MIGSIIQFGINMAAYSASSAAVMKTAKIASSNFRRVAKLANTYIANREIRETGFGKAALKLTANEGSAVRNYYSRNVENVKKAIQNRTSESTRHILRGAGNLLGEEARFMPANYIYYKMEKHKSVSPEDKEANSSFAKYYFGAPMLMSMGTGMAMNRIPGMSKTAVKHVLKKSTPGQRATVVKGLAGAAKGGAIIMDRAIAAARATRVKAGSAGLSSFVSMGGMSGRNKEKFGVIYSKELRRLKSEPISYNRREMELSSLHDRIDSQLKNLEPALKRKGKYEFASSQFEEVKRDISKHTLEGYKGEMNKDNQFMKMMNWMADSLHDESLRTRRATDSKGTPVDFGKYVVGSTNVDFGRMNMAFMKNIMIRTATNGRNPVSALTSLFGQSDLLKYQDSDHAVGLSYTKGKAGKLFVGRTYGVEKGSKETAADIVGVSILDRVLSPEQNYLVEGFIKSQRDIIKHKHGITDERSIDYVLSKAYQHGEIQTKTGDLLVHFPGGKLKMYTSFRDGNETKPISFQLGRMDNGEYLNYYKFTRLGVNKATRYFYGQEELETSGKQIKVGPTQVGKVIPDEEGQGLWNRIKTVLDLGNANERWLGNKAISVFKKFRDPRYAKTFFDNKYISNPEIQKYITKEMSMQIDMGKMLNNEGKEAMENFVASMTNRMGGSDAFVNILEDPNNKTSSFVKQMLISDQMGSHDAKNRITAFMDYAKNFKNEGIDLALLKDNLGIANNMRTAFLESQEHTKVYETLYGINTGKHIWSNGKRRELTKVEEYNALVLSTVVGDTGKYGNPIKPFSETFYLNHANPKEVSEFAAASHLSQFHHKTNMAISSRYKNNIVYGEATNNSIQTSENEISNLLKLYSDPNGMEYNSIKQYYNKSWRHSNLLPHDLDNRLRVEESYDDELFAMPKGIGSGIIRKRKLKGSGTEVAEGIMDAGNMAVMSMLYSFNNVMGQALGLGLDETKIATPGAFLKSMIGKRILPGIAAYMGYNVLDRFADKTMDGTPLGEGLTVFGANIIAGARVSAASALDTFGITDASKYLENLMPGSIESPLSGLARFAAPVAIGLVKGGKMGGSVGSLTGGLIGTAVGGLLGGGPLGLFGQWNINKSREEVVNILSGKDEVAIKKGRWWELGKSAFEGTRTEYYRPHMYALLRANYKDTPGLKDSFMKDTIGALAPDIYAMQNYYSRPYPVTAGIFSDIPVLSSTMAMLPGLPIGGGIPMHQNDWSTRYQKSVAMDNGMTTEDIATTYGAGNGYFSSTTPGATGSEMDTSIMPIETPLNRAGFDFGLGESVMNIKDIVGMRGFILGETYTSLTGRRDLMDYAPEMASPTDIAGIRRSYWDMELGGMLGMSEIIRRYIPRRRTQMEIFNPLINAMPNWLPNEDYMTDFQHGDPYTKITMGEARLPGAAYESIHNVDVDMPIEADILAESYDSQMAYFLGMPEYMVPRKRKTEIAKNVADGVRENARKFGDLVKGDAAVYNAKYNTRATVDAIVKNQDGQRMAIKVAPTGFGGVSSLNAFLTMAELDQGLLMEVDTDTGDITQKIIKKDINKFADDLQRTQKARWASYRQMGDMEKEGKAINLGNAYSWFNRYKILADVGMYSKEFREADAIVQQQMSAGYLNENQVNEYFTIKEQNKKKEKAFEFSEYRFLTLGDSLTEAGKERDKQIRAEFSPTERAIGGAWEYVSHLRTPIHSKLLHKTTALEEYERNVIYGKTMPMWENPYEDYIKSYAQQMIAEDDPFQGALSWSTGGMLMGGMPLAGFMGAMGAMIGGANAISGNVYIPERVNEVRSIMEQADAVEYGRYRNEYNETGDKRLSVRSSRTMAGSILNDKILDPMVASSALGGQEKAYFEDIVGNVTKGNLNKISQMLPREALPVLYNEIGDTKTANSYSAQLKKELSLRQMPGLESSIYNSDVPLEIPAYKTFEMEGANAHDAGLGWYNQISAMNRLKAMGKYNDETLYASKFETQYTMKDLQKTLTDTNKLRNNLRKISTNVNIIDDGLDSIEVEIIM